MTRKYLLPNTAQHKANLHCHTTLSDGRISPEEMQAAYKRHGYSIMAFTDHEYIVNHQNFNDENFIAITGYEIGLYTPAPPGNWEDTWRDRKCCHLNLYAKAPNEDRHVMFDPDALPNHVKGKADTFRYIGEKCKRGYEDIQKVIDIANENGFLVCLNHPFWSLQPQWDIIGLHGLFAMEVYNAGGSDLGKNNPFLNSYMWNDYGAMVEYGMNVAPIAADDNHNYNHDIENSDSFRGYTMICTNDFTYSGIIKALEEQSFYASTGIEINKLYLEDGKVIVECTECTMVLAFFGGIRWDSVSDKNGIVRAEFPIPKGAKYIRLLLSDERNGKAATTKAYREF